MHRMAGVAAAAGAALGLAWATQVPIPSAGDGMALLRLAWRARPERIERCVTQSAEALAELPAHMRQQIICDGRSASYRLQVRLDGQVVADHIVEAGGLRHDRPLYVFREMAITPGSRHVQVTFERVEAESDSGDSNEEREILREAVPATLTWDERLEFPPNAVRVISYDPGRRVLFEVSPPRTMTR